MGSASACKFLCKVCFCCLLTLFFGTSPARAQEETTEIDPYETSNRDVYAFNTFVDRIILLPGAKVYNFVTPDFAQTGVDNFFYNLGEPYTIFNNILQLKMVDAYTSAARFGINSVLGLFGLIDVAAYMGLEGRGEDLGQTLGVWGMESGAYLEIPFLGPSTERDLIPTMLLFFYSPTSQLLQVSSTQNIALRAINIADTRNRLRQFEANIVGDRYTFIRDAYLQNRQYQVFDGRLPTDDLWLYQEDNDTLEELDELDELDELPELDAP